MGPNNTVCIRQVLHQHAACCGCNLTCTGIGIFTAIAIANPPQSFLIALLGCGPSQGHQPAAEAVANGGTIDHHGSNGGRATAAVCGGNF